MALDTTAPLMMVLEKDRRMKLKQDVARKTSSNVNNSSIQLKEKNIISLYLAIIISVPM